MNLAAYIYGEEKAACARSVLAREPYAEMDATQVLCVFGKHIEKWWHAVIFSAQCDAPLFWVTPRARECIIALVVCLLAKISFYQLFHTNVPIFTQAAHTPLDTKTLVKQRIGPV